MQIASGASWSLAGEKYVLLENSPLLRQLIFFARYSRLFVVRTDGMSIERG
jgi:hypothetical protein